MKSRRHAPEREQPERRAELHHRENLRHRRGRLLDLLEQSSPHSPELRRIKIPSS